MKGECASGASNPHGGSYAMGPGQPVQVRHGWFCACLYCLIGHR